MDLKSSISVMFFLFLLLCMPYFSTGGSELLDSEVYEIDYKGPETHSSIPPPDHSHVKPLTHRESGVKPPKPKGLRAGNIRGKGRKVRG